MTNRVDAEYGSPILQAEQITIEMFGEDDYKAWPFKKTCEALCALHSRVEAARQQGRDEGLREAALICENRAGEYPKEGDPCGEIVCADRIRAIIGQPAQEGKS